MLDHLITDKQDKIDVSVNEGHSMQKSSSLGISNIRVENVPLISTILVVDINATLNCKHELFTRDPNFDNKFINSNYYYYLISIVSCHKALESRHVGAELSF